MCKTTNNKEGSSNLKQRMVLGFPVKEKKIKKKTHTKRERERERERNIVLCFCRKGKI